ncbi:hypothetical protein AAXB25_14885 [Paenibacillus lautus]|uniref:hypothetical protein n=1 Tax=Paenibacillus lautus TaxID=1401 RepID=UPI003D28F9EE
MGWNIELRSDVKIEEKDVEEFVSNLPRQFSSPFGNMRNPWGWSTRVDLVLQHNVLRMSGAYSISGDIAKEYADYAKEYFERIGYSTNLIENW